MVMKSGLKDVLKENIQRKRAQIHHEKSWVPGPLQTKPKISAGSSVASVEINANSNYTTK